MRADRTAFLRAFALTTVFVLSFFGAAAFGVDAETHRQEVDSWHQDRIERLQAPGSWLTLVGLAWLGEGESSCGSDPESTVVLPPSVPPKVGTFHLTGDRVEFVAAAGAGVQSLGKDVGRLTLEDDSGGTPTLLEIGSVTFFVIRRGDRFGVRVKDSESPTRTAFHGIERYPVSLDWRLEASFEPYDPPKPIPVPTAIGTIDDESSPGALVFQTPDGGTHRLDALPGADDDELFLVFGDTTNGHETYGGGRFLYARRGEGKKIVVDFNKAYNPPCAFTAYATCPLPPQQNRLGVPVRAGEKKYGEGSH